MGKPAARPSADRGAITTYLTPKTATVVSSAEPTLPAPSIDAMLTSLLAQFNKLTEELAAQRAMTERLQHELRESQQRYAGLTLQMKTVKTFAKYQPHC